MKKHSGYELYVPETLALAAPFLQERSALKAAALARKLRPRELRVGDHSNQTILPAIARRMPRGARDSLLHDYFTEAAKLAESVDEQDVERAVSIIEAFATLLSDGSMSDEILSRAFKVSMSLGGEHRTRSIEALAPHLGNDQLADAASSSPNLVDNRNLRSTQAFLNCRLAGVGPAIEVINNDLDALVELAGTLDGNERAGVLRRAVEVFSTIGRKLDRRVYRSHAEVLGDVLPGLSARDVEREIATVTKDIKSAHHDDHAQIMAVLAPKMSDRQIMKVFYNHRKYPSELGVAEIFAALGPYLPASTLAQFQKFVRSLINASDSLDARLLARAGLVGLQPDAASRTRAAAEVLFDLDEAHRWHPESASARGWRREITRMDSTHGQLHRAHISGEHLQLILRCVLPYLSQDSQEALVSFAERYEAPRWEKNAPYCAFALLVPHVTTGQRRRVLQKLATAVRAEAELPGGRPARILARVDTTAVWFWQAVVDEARTLYHEHQKAAVLRMAFARAPQVSWHSADPDSVGPVRESLVGLSLPGLLEVIRGLARHLNTLGGKDAVRTTKEAVDEVSRWFGVGQSQQVRPR